MATATQQQVAVVGGLATLLALVLAYYRFRDRNNRNGIFSRFLFWLFPAADDRGGRNTVNSTRMGVKTDYDPTLAQRSPVPTTSTTSVATGYAPPSPSVSSTQHRTDSGVSQSSTSSGTTGSGTSSRYGAESGSTMSSIQMQSYKDGDKTESGDKSKAEDIVPLPKKSEVKTGAAPPTPTVSDSDTTLLGSKIGSKSGTTDPTSFAHSSSSDTSKDFAQTSTASTFTSLSSEDEAAKKKEMRKKQRPRTMKQRSKTSPSATFDPDQDKIEYNAVPWHENKTLSDDFSLDGLERREMCDCQATRDIPEIEDTEALVDDAPNLRPDIRPTYILPVVFAMYKPKNLISTDSPDLSPEICSAAVTLPKKFHDKTNVFTPFRAILHCIVYASKHGHLIKELIENYSYLES
ncbi:unnamed protein product [Bursaphelenchus okinawaensis]|uniref:Uncharacterized protein n=1 Tax=Bursaphelenchus okinawaensis TaxID=465554 RepID=A0A811JQI2_9BILA|nr:unnamed protein product [Bursaphelenchus okinawaensis]CAG9077953.1 unnamed protein product [Bursaphelenchus okinawaensis]